LNTFGIVALIILVILLAALVWVAGHVSIFFNFFRENSKEEANIKVKGWGFSYLYQTRPSLWLSCNQHKLFAMAKDKSGEPGGEQAKSRKNLRERINYFVLPHMFNALAYFFRHTRWAQCKVIFSAGTGDAAHTAVIIGLARSLGAHLASWCKSKMNFTEEQPVLEFYPDYNRKNLSVDVAFAFHIRIYQIIIIGLYLIYHFKIKWEIHRRRG